MRVLVEHPPNAVAAYVLAHGAGAGMEHPFMASLSAALAGRGIASLRFNFPYLEGGSKRVDAPPVAHAAIREAVAEAARRFPGLPLLAGGKSFGGRMTSQAQSIEALANVRGLVFVGFPLHAAGKPSVDRAGHLAQVAVPMLFLQGTRDALAEWPLIEGVASKLGAKATLHRVEGADHAFHVLAKSGRTDAEVIAELADAVGAFAARVAA